MIDETYSLVFADDEIGIVVAQCKQPWSCECNEDVEPRCCYTAEEIKQRVANYYRRRAEQVEALSIQEFMSDKGIYFTPKD